jgi:predicted nucleic acid-binding protein
MIYLDSSVALAALLAEPRSPPQSFWTAPLVTSRLLEYETLNRLHARGLGAAGVAAARKLLDGLAFSELTPSILIRALAPFPTAVRTLDALHLATMHYLRARGQTLRLAPYDLRLGAAATALGFPLVAL